MKHYILALAFLITGCTPSIDKEAIDPQELQSFQNTTDDIHYHAGFIVIEDGIQKDFSGWQYMNITPCSEQDQHQDRTPEEDQLETAHLHDQIGDVVHVHRPQATWGDLFQNLGLEYQKESIQAFSDDGQEITDPLNSLIDAYQSVVFIVGEYDQSSLSELLNHAVDQDRILHAESLTESCGV